MNSQTFAKDKRRVFGTLWLVGWLALGAFFLWEGIHPNTNNPTPVNTNATFLRAEVSRNAKPIEEVTVGERVTTQLSERARIEAARELGSLPWWDEEQVDPATWRRIELTTTNYLGHPSQVVLLRPLRWIEEHRAKAGASIEISMPEQGVEGPAHVVSIGPCPEIAESEGRVVTGTFSHLRGDILQIHIAGAQEPIDVTDNHPIWSTDQQKFVSADELSVGESLRHLDGVTQITRIQHIPAEQSVYNLEIHGDHVYHVSMLGVLVHNTTPGTPLYRGVPGNATEIDHKANVDPNVKAETILQLMVPAPLGEGIRHTIETHAFDRKGFKEVWISPFHEESFPLTST